MSASRARRFSDEISLPLGKSHGRGVLLGLGALVREPIAEVSVALKGEMLVDAAISTWRPTKRTHYVANTTITRHRVLVTRLLMRHLFRFISADLTDAREIPLLLEVDLDG